MKHENLTLDIQTPPEKILGPQNTSWGSAFRGSKHLQTQGMTGGFWKTRVKQMVQKPLYPTTIKHHNLHQTLGLLENHRTWEWWTMEPKKYVSEFRGWLDP